MKAMIKLIVLALLVSLLLFSCSKMNRENYDKIKVGMAYFQVIDLIGEPDKCDAALGMKNCVWGNETKNITIGFIAEKVVMPTMTGL